MSKTSLSKQPYHLVSLNLWALTSFLIVILPLIIAIFYTVSEVGNYTRKSQTTLFKAVHETESTRIIHERLNSMERNMRQIQLFGKSVFYTLYEQNRYKFLNQMTSLSQQKVDKQLSNQLQLLKNNENTLHRYILNKLKDENSKLTQEDINSFDHLTKQAKILLDDAEQRISKKAALLSSSAESFTKQFIYLAIFSILLALFLALLFVRLLTRPINDIALAIRSLGNEGFERAIAIRGPKDLQQLGDQLEWLRLKLGSLEHEKKQFIRNVSHELKTPLATLKEGTDLLSENVVGELNAEQQDIIQLMKIGNITIKDLVENLLEYQRSISTKIIFNRSTFILETLVIRITEEYELLLRSKNITLISNLDSTNINADYEKLKIIISNIFSNALKYSPPNSSIRLTLSSDDNIVTLMIEDQGIGINKDIEKLMFTEFFRGNPASDWKIKASGLGLALVKHYIDIHNGSVKLLPSSLEYCGARFAIHLPQNKNQINDKLI